MVTPVGVQRLSQRREFATIQINTSPIIVSCPSPKLASPKYDRIGCRCRSEREYRLISSSCGSPFSYIYKGYCEICALMTSLSVKLFVYLVLTVVSASDLNYFPSPLKFAP
ncbi:hypothetical protein AB6A40_003169 [Gnathostoma spinigerum]|uniref:Uncharacterized protein n=1 Tax=Gnathostoma spinigerum TaxID=75299 RepID=A0ABD6E8R1_9BILA